MDTDKQAVKISETALLSWQFGSGRCAFTLEVTFEDGSRITVASSVPATSDLKLRDLQSRAVDAAAEILSAAAKPGADGLAERLLPAWSVTGAKP